MARPSTYDSKKDYPLLAEKYLANCGREQTKLPKISEFCREYLGKDEETVDRWLEGLQLPQNAKNVEKLRGAIKRIKDAQAEQLQDDGLYGGKEVNNAMAIFLLKANHGFIEPARLEVTGANGQPFTIAIKLDLAGGYVPPMGAIITTPGTSYPRSPQIQGSSLAQTGKEDNNSPNGVN